MAGDILQVHAPKRSPLEKDFCPSLTVRLRNGDKIRVPVDGEANKAANQILAAKLRDIIDMNLDFLRHKNIPLEPGMLKELAAAVTAVDRLTNSTYFDVPVPPAEGGAIGKLAGELVKSAAEGMAKGNASNFQERMDKIKELGKKQTKVIEAEVSDVKKP